MSKKLTPKPAKEAQFQIDAALFEELGERLVSRPEIALAELVKNAYDADASRCTVSISDESIVVADTGHGLTEREFLSNWMVVSSQNKGKQRFSRHYGRSMAGSKGIGRFSARFLGSHLVLTSVATNPSDHQLYRLTATFDWELMARGRSVATITIPYSVEKVSAGTGAGTTLTITGLRENVRHLPHDRVRTDILRLIDPASGLEKPPFASAGNPSLAKDPGFVVNLTDESAGLSGSPSSNETSPDLAKAILQEYVGRVRIEVDEQGSVDLKVFWRGNDKPIEKKRFQLSRFARALTQHELSKHLGDLDARGLPLELEDVQHLPVATHLNSPVFIDVRFFPRRQGTFANSVVNGTKAHAWIRDHASMPIVDNKFAMPAYADVDSDWLGVEASKAINERNWQSIFTPAFFPMDPADRSDPQRNAMLALPRMSQLIGQVHIATRKRLDESSDEEGWLQPNMDRESLRANGAYRLLWHLSRFAVESLAHFDRKIRLAEKDEAEVRARQEARSALEAAIAEIKQSKEIEPSHKSAVLGQLHLAEVRMAEASSYEREARLSLEMMALMGVMAGFMTHEFDKALAALQAAGSALAALSTERPELAEAASRVLENEHLLSNYADYMRLFISKARTPIPETFKAKAQLIAATATLGSLASAHQVDIKIDVDSKLPGPFVPLAAYHGIAVNLVSNAMKAAVARLGKGPRLVRLYATNEGNKHVLVCADNGIGIPEFLRDRIWDPLFTTTAGADQSNPLNSGLGLGLSVVRRVVEGVAGRIELMNTPPPGFVTAFRVTMPLKSE